ncbi:MAG: hypothetical protein H8E79_03750 [Desulfobulbaceae bacterium]|uniref:Uncharacterized protein n=1 Tax=Candidatus Desulfatifera sulfidica TaxID=2841691 RepID=A0A8J6TA43_9BACT|nr:hypothetical protein [Candidatus Desulfatifera sulfidica]
MTNQENNTAQESRLIPVLREGVAVIQMIVYKELRNHLGAKHPDRGPGFLGLLSGALTNALFGSNNPEPRFQDFFKTNRGLIEQELLGLAQELPHLQDPLSDALRILTLCDQQEELAPSDLLVQADALGLLNHDRELPLPSVFMETVRQLGSSHNLIIPPTSITTEDDQLVTQ